MLTIPSLNHSPHGTTKKICHHLCSCSLVFVCICYTISWARSLVLHPLKVKAWLCKYSPKGSCLCVLLCPWLCCSQVDYKCWKFQFCGLNLCGSFCWLFGTFAAWVWTDLSQVLARLLLNFRGFVCSFSFWNCRLCCEFVVRAHWLSIELLLFWLSSCVLSLLCYITCSREPCPCIDKRWEVCECLWDLSEHPKWASVRACELNTFKHKSDFCFALTLNFLLVC